MADSTTQSIQAALSVGIISLILVLFVIVYLVNPSIAERLRGAATGAESSSMFTNVSAIVGILGAVAPDVVMLSGYVSDIVAGEFKYSLLSLMAIIVAIINWIIFGGFGGLVAGVSSPDAEAGTGLVSTVLNTGEAAGTGLVSTVLNAINPTSSTAIPTNLIGVAREASARAPRNPRTSERNRIGVARAGPSIGPNGTVLRQPGTLASLGGTATNPSLGTTTRTTGLGFTHRRPVARGGARYPDQIIARDPTVVRGLGLLDTQKSPMGLAILTFIFMIYLMDMSVNKKRDVPDILLSFFTGLFILGLNIASYGIFKSYGDSWMDRLWPIARASGLGGVLGICIFYILNAFGSQYLPLDSKGSGGGGGSTPSSKACIAPFIYDPASGDCVCPNGKLKVGNTCQVPSSSTERFSLMSGTEHFTEKVPAPSAKSDEFVCDLYQGGKKITTIGM